MKKLDTDISSISEIGPA